MEKSANSTRMRNKRVSVNIDQLSTAQHILGKYRTKKQAWITDYILNMCDKRRSLKTTKYQSEDHAVEYIQIHNMISRSMKTAKNEWLSSQCKSIDKYLRRGIHSKGAFDTVISITNSKPRITKIIKDKNCVHLADDNSRIVLQRSL